jgi:ABC-2 type transport system ATP-binding protein
MITVKTEKLSKMFTGKYAVKDVHLELEEGKIYGLLGPNGSGKTTLMKMIAGLFYPKSGDIKVYDKPLSIESRNYVAFMSTEQSFYKYMSIQNVGEFYQDFYQDFDMNSFKELIAFMELEMDMKVKNLSSGMSAKLKVAATLARNAKIFMLDEPLNGIDMLAREQILNAIIKVSNENNVILLSSHLVDAMENILDNVILIKNGEIALSCNVEKIREEDKKSIVDKYKEVFLNA